MNAIAVRTISEPAVEYIFVDGEMKCAHVNAVVEPPCCGPMTSPADCGCAGQYSVWCPDCPIENLTDEDVNEILTRGEDRGEDY